MKVLIAGAGPTGLSAGVELARRGVTVEIFERRTNASTLSRAIGISPSSLELLTASGVTDRLLEEGVKYRTMRFFHGVRPWAEVAMSSAKPVQYGHNYMLGLPQDDTERILRDVFVGLGGTIHIGCEVTGVAQSHKSVQLTLSDGDTFEGDYLIGADGVKSTVRGAVGIDYPGHALPDVWSIADVEADAWPHRDSVSMFMLPNGRMAAVLPLGGRRVRLISNSESALRAMPIDVQVSKIHREGQFRVSLCQVDDYSKDRVFLAGDAAHSQSPAGGRGMNLGISDACDLAARLAGDGDLAAFSAVRHAEGKRVMAGAERMRQIVTSRSKLRRFAALSMLKTATKIPTLQRLIANMVLYG